MSGEILVIFAAGAAAYVLVRYRLIKYAQPLRLRLAEVGEDFVADRNHPQPHRDRVTFMLDNAYNWWFMTTGIVIAPVMMVSLVTKPSLRQMIGDEWMTGDQNTRGAYRRIEGMFIKSTIIANPIFALIFLVEILAFNIVLAVFGGTIQSADVMLKALMRKESGFKSKTAHA